MIVNSFRDKMKMAINDSLIKSIIVGFVDSNLPFYNVEKSFLSCMELDKENAGIVSELENNNFLNELVLDSLFFKYGGKEAFLSLDNSVKEKLASEVYKEIKNSIFKKSKLVYSSNGILGNEDTDDLVHSFIIKVSPEDFISVLNALYKVIKKGNLSGIKIVTPSTRYICTGYNAPIRVKCTSEYLEKTLSMLDNIPSILKEKAKPVLPIYNIGSWYGYEQLLGNGVPVMSRLAAAIYDAMYEVLQERGESIIINEENAQEFFQNARNKYVALRTIIHVALFNNHDIIDLICHKTKERLSKFEVLENDVFSSKVVNEELARLYNLVDEEEIASIPVPMKIGIDDTLEQNVVTSSDVTLEENSVAVLDDESKELSESSPNAVSDESVEQKDLQEPINWAELKKGIILTDRDMAAIAAIAHSQGIEPRGTFAKEEKVNANYLNAISLVFDQYKNAINEAKQTALIEELSSKNAEQEKNIKELQDWIIEAIELSPELIYGSTPSENDDDIQEFSDSIDRVISIIDEMERARDCEAAYSSLDGDNVQSENVNNFGEQADSSVVQTLEAGKNTGDMTHSTFAGSNSFSNDGEELNSSFNQDLRSNVNVNVKPVPMVEPSLIEPLRDFENTKGVLIPNLADVSYEGDSLKEALRTGGYMSDFEYIKQLAEHFKLGEYANGIAQNRVILHNLRHLDQFYSDGTPRAAKEYYDFVVSTIEKYGNAVEKNENISSSRVDSVVSAPIVSDFSGKTGVVVKTNEDHLRKVQEARRAESDSKQKVGFLKKLRDKVTGKKTTEVADDSATFDNIVDINSHKVDKNSDKYRYADVVSNVALLDRKVKGQNYTILDYFDTYDLLEYITPESTILLHESGMQMSAKDFVSLKLIEYLINNGEGTLDEVIAMYVDEIMTPPAVKRG